MSVSPESILSFWFEETRPIQWFRRDPHFDGTIQSRFGGSVETALAGKLQHWTTAPTSGLALVLLLDQFPRNIWRNTARAFSGDAEALNVSIQAEKQGWIGSESRRPRRQFWLIPRLHSEDLAIQTQALPLFERWTDQRTLEVAQRYRDTIAMHGRFPHRDLALGR